MLVLAGAGAAYQLLSAALLGGAFRPAGAARLSSSAPVTILKPLHGAEPRLRANLATFAAQDYGGAVQIVCGVQSATDPAIAAVDRDMTLVVDSARHGSNAKVSNLVNMMAAAKHDILVLSDSDMAVAPGYLSQLVAALDQPSVGAVTCLYNGRGDAGFWSRLAAMGIDTHFLPSIVVGRAIGLADPCMGSTIAIRRATLDRIGGFPAFADVLADDYALGAAVRRLGLTVAIPPLLVTHACADSGFADLIRHELRWATTIRRLDPAGFIGSGLVNPLPFAVLAMLVLGPTPLAAAVFAATIASRLCVAVVVARLARSHAESLWLLPIRDFVTFGVFLAAFLVQSVDWRGSRLKVARDGRIGPG